MQFTLLPGVTKRAAEFSFLIAEDEEGRYEPIDMVSTFREASDLAARLKRLEANQDPGICPCIYKLFGRKDGGTYAVIATCSALDFRTTPIQKAKQ